jgi:hypothetical protein
MARGHDDGSDAEDGPILSPDELDIANDEHVAEIDDGRYVVSPNDPIGDIPGTSGSDSGTARGDTPPDPSQGTTPDESAASASAGSTTDPGAEAADPQSQPEPTVTEGDVREWLSEEFAATDSRYGFDVTATFDGSIEHRRMVSNDVVTIFESLVLWYAQQIDSNTPVEEVLGILLMEASVPVRYPTASLQRVLDSTELEPEDSIADLAAAIEDEGFRI